MSLRNYIVDYKLLNRRDKKTGRLLCRYCGGIVPIGRKKFYCNDECKEKVYEKYGWGYIRDRVLKRDNYSCQFRGVNKKTGELIICNYSEKKDQSPSLLEIHHVISVVDMRQLLWDMVYKDHIIRKEDYRLAFMNMFVEESNLITYDREHHDLIHKKDFNYRKSAKRIVGDYSRFLREFRAIQRLNYRDRVQKSLDIFF